MEDKIKQASQDITDLLVNIPKAKRMEDEVDRMLRDDQEMDSYYTSQRKLTISNNYSTKARRTTDNGGIF